MTLLKAENVRKQYSNHLALDDVSVNIPDKSIYGLLGPNGAGKTTLLRIINQITAPDSGTVFLDGHRLGPSDLANIGYLPEERGLYKKMKVGEQSIYLAMLKGLSRQEAIGRLKKWFTKFEIIDWWDKKVEELSKGMQQKIQFVTTVLHEPRLLIFDEPFSGFDPINANLLKQEILDLRDKGSTIIFSTHNMGSVEELCDHITLIDRSKTILEGSVSQIRNEWAANEYLVEFKGRAEVKDNSVYKVLSKEEDKDVSRIHLKSSGDKDVNHIVGDMLKAGNLLSFNPALPSMNEIFIRVVEANSDKLNN
ncbi:MAG: ATP-binding cassette domain-containing protein [Marinilabiliaceae bacterium]|jgi:ABC-2 type transport system ATP-binding protein|nr:ATP-binding cassette domain-containing protein [Marinilabiliaceae bacterium]